MNVFLAWHITSKHRSDDFGALISSGQYSGSMLSYHPINNYEEYLTYDKKFRDACCGVAQMCNLYFKRRPSQDCSGYNPPTWGRIMRHTYVML